MTVVLLIGGTDSSGGAGVLQDGRVLEAFGCTARLIVTAVTAQGQGGVRSILPIPREMLLAQAEAVASLGPVAAVKIGLIPSRETEDFFAELLPRFWPNAAVVLDPVAAASAGGLLREELKYSALWACASLVTPNLLEAARALKVPEASNRRAMTAQAAALRATGVRAVLLKGGHLLGRQAADFLLTETGGRWFCGPRRPGARRGTGCALASAIAAGLARGMVLPEAIAAARRWLRQSWPKTILAN